MSYAGTGLIQAQKMSGKSATSVPNDEVSQTSEAANVDKRYECTACRKCFSSKHNLTMHMDEHCGIKRYKCDLCNKSFRQKRSLNAHAQKCMPNEHNCIICNINFWTKKELYAHMETHKGVSYECILCRKSFPTLAHLDTHTDTHMAELKHRCHVCSKIFFNAVMLKKHLDSHYIDKEYECMMCGLTFSSEVRLKSHIMDHEKGITNCTLCNRKFSCQERFEKHMAEHNRKKKYVCKICGKGCVTSSYLKDHMDIHEGIKRHSCPICQKKFRFRGALSAHMNEHNLPYERVLKVGKRNCRKEFKSQNGEDVVVPNKNSVDLDFDSGNEVGGVDLGSGVGEAQVDSFDTYSESWHKKKYSPNRENSPNGSGLQNIGYDPQKCAKTHKCPVCKKEFMLKSTLKLHMNVHEEKKYFCPICNKKFSYKCNLNTHIKMTHKSLQSVPNVSSPDNVSEKST
ncbi:zinc finger protein 569-like [Macrobrachium nipponense]|uniref:zinc finger protein 569-like n=1 Tax=Macrobrachium nipponense TaxID=159736 RepID=UPI0030C80F2D